MLDDFQLTPDILKIDVEETESEVIKGALGTIEASLPVILVEGTAIEIEALLGSLGYSRYRYDVASGDFLHGQSGSLNTFLLRPGHLPLFR